MQKLNTKLNTKLNITPIKAFNKVAPISTVKQVDNTTVRADNVKSGNESSSWVKFFEYDEEKQVLTITFRDGFTAHYPNITKDEAAAFAEDGSKGRYVYRFLRNRKY